jgi:hypothetical protein
MRNLFILAIIVVCAVLGMAGVTVLVRSGFSDVPYYHLPSAGALVVFSIVIVGALVCAVVWLLGYAVLSVVRGHGQQPLPHSRQVPAKISELEHEPQRLPGQRKRIIKSLPPSKSQRRKFAIGVRNGSPSIAKIASANLQDDTDENLQDDMDANLQDEIDRKIIEAYADLRSQNRKPTGIAIANMTGVAQRTVYDRAEKIRGRGIML